ARADVFVADVAVPGEEGVELDLQGGAGAEVAVAPFARERVIALSVPDETCFAEAGSGGDHGEVSADRGVAAVEGFEVGGGQLGDPVGGRCQVVDQLDRAEADRVGDLPGVDDPRE